MAAGDEGTGEGREPEARANRSPADALFGALSEASDRADDAADDLADEEVHRKAVHTRMLAEHEERLAEQRASAIAAGRRKGGVAGAAMAGAMLAVAEIYEGPPKEDAPVTVEASSDPTDLDKDGLDVTVNDVDVSAPPLERVDPVVGTNGARRRR